MVDFDFDWARRQAEAGVDIFGGGIGLVDTTPIVDPGKIGNVTPVPNGPAYEDQFPPEVRAALRELANSTGRATTIDSVGLQDLIAKNASSSGTGTGTDFSPAADARNTISQVLEQYGLASLSDFLYQTYAKQEVNLNNPDALIYAIKDQPAYQQRFAGNASRKKKGLAELSPASYVGLENSYRDLLRANGLPPGFFDQNDDFQKFIENDMSPRELQDRIQSGFKEVDNADPEVLRQIQLLYPESGITGSRESLAAFFLDPVKAAPLLARQAQAAKIGAKAYETGGVQLTAGVAEGIASYNYSDAQVQSAFGDLNQQAGLLNEMQGEAQLTQEEKLGAVFGTNIGAQKQINQRRDTRKAIFSSGGRGTATSGRGGTSESGYGNAQ